jgi:hypothetical protein
MTDFHAYAHTHIRTHTDPAVSPYFTLIDTDDRYAVAHLTLSRG